jgi:hypothetical protein
MLITPCAVSVLVLRCSRHHMLNQENGTARKTGWVNVNYLAVFDQIPVVGPRLGQVVHKAVHMLPLVPESDGE